MKRVVQVGMPQMALGCLSENWLLKELGDLHWETLCSSLQRSSNDLVDSQDRRLYATFVRIGFELDGTLKDFPEGDELTFSGRDDAIWTFDGAEHNRDQRAKLIG